MQENVIKVVPAEVLAALPSDGVEAAGVLHPFWLDYGRRRYQLTDHEKEEQLLQWMAIGNRLRENEAAMDSLGLSAEAMNMDLGGCDSLDKLAAVVEGFWSQVFSMASAKEKQAEWSDRHDALLESIALGAEHLEYRVKPADVAKIQSQLDVLRELIRDADELTDAHRKRLLSRVERVQQALHERMERLDRMLGALADVQVLARAAGEAGVEVLTQARRIGVALGAAIAVYVGPALLGKVGNGSLGLPGTDDDAGMATVDAGDEGLEE